jgi:asparagine synthase (glutamine-hydrolysing)
MCGLAGRFSAGLLPPDPAWAERADRLLEHRGPDGRGHYLDGSCELVHRRLALLDLSPTGSQPMANENGTVYVVFNGEIYNHRQLRFELEARGHSFRGRSDTEVLVHLYEEYGERMASRLRGMFAFAIYDRVAHRLVLGRDRFGIKPLFYARHGAQWAFASEMKAILALDGFRPELDRQACYDFLGLSYIPEPATGFANISALPKGTTLVIDDRGPRSTCFAQVLPHPAGEMSPSELAGRVGELLGSAVSRQGTADVPVAALLSGGIDSSLVVAAHARKNGGTLKTFNVSFPDPEHDETPLALATARQYGTDHFTIGLGAENIAADSIFDLLAHFDQPFADPSLVPTHAVSRAVREQGIICTLTGDGGDEAFGGYQELWRAEQLKQMMATPDWILATAGGLARPLAGWTRNRGRQALKAVQLARAGRSSPAALLAGLSSYLSEPEKEQLVTPAARTGLEAGYRHFGSPYETLSDLESISRRMTQNLFEVGLPSDMLRKVDMMSMRAGLEVRVPMLDEDLVGIGLSLSHRMKTDGRTGKLVLRELAARWLPSAVAKHPKHGFTIPLDVMVSGDFHDAVQDLLGTPASRTGAFLQQSLVRSWLAQFRAAVKRGTGGAISREGLYLRVLMVLSLELWLRKQELVW